MTIAKGIGEIAPGAIIKKKIKLKRRRKLCGEKENLSRNQERSFIDRRDY